MCHPSASPWTPERVEQLTTLVADKRSASQIADEMGVSRNAVIGKSHRLKLQLDGIRPKRESSGRRDSGGGAVRAIAAKLARAGFPPCRTSSLAFEVLARASNPVNAPLLDLRSDQCRWPTDSRDGRVPTHLFCGAPAIPLSPYCPAHYAASIAPPRGRA